MKKVLLGAAVTITAIGIFNSLEAQAAESQQMYRLYNPNSGEHFYTANTNEKTVLIENRWDYEGIGWVAPTTGDPVYRLYNPNAGDHHYTLNSYEKNSLVKAGWQDEGIGWYSDVNQTIPLQRAYNPRAQAGSHNYTTNTAEQNILLQTGWQSEGVAWYAVGPGKPLQSIPYHKLNPNNPLQKAVINLNSRVELESDAVRIYPVFSGMIQTIGGYYDGYIGADTMNLIKEKVRVASLYTNGRPVSLISWARNNMGDETIISAQNGTITYFLEK
ncbi:hypothetical protein [Enterococcus sp. CSURQ0835]|uniref:hypothetical protein n=1 Tax=Enterococcus sp. CSURQ0835 TaxID=2681394 RepID=UPI00135C8FE6|nr:hypothetical protein [Enterococcus sp. CSURQ0835]